VDCELLRGRGRCCEPWVKKGGEGKNLGELLTFSLAFTKKESPFCGKKRRKGEMVMNT